MKPANYLNSLKALEATCRLGSYGKAADELCVSSEAVGQLVRKLESHLDIQLFNRDRKKRQLIPTSQVVQMLPKLTQAFRSLSGIEEELVSSSQRAKLIISAPPSLASKWLIPRLHLIREVVKSADLQLNVTSELVNFDAGDADIGIRYGAGAWDNLITHKIFENEKFFPVCSKGFLEDNPNLKEITDLSKYTLIKDNTIKDSSFPSWTAWFEKFGLSYELSQMRYLEFNIALMAIDAAIMGEGIALVRNQLVKNELKSGSLVRLFGELEIDSNWGYYVVMSNSSSARAKELFSWFVEHGGEL